jgi:predicted transposase YbfD/YdcC
MTATPSPAKTTTFFELLRQTPGLDGRDNRGLKHDMAFVITGLTLAMFCGRDGRLSSLHRHMVNHFEELCVAVCFWPERAISRAQLPLLLARVDGGLFARLLFDWFGLVLDEEAKLWFSLDGKELRGSIQPGHKRGEACVSALAHRTEQVVGQTYYNGAKESERPAVRKLLEDSGLCSQKITLDALHLVPKTLNTIHEAKGIYLIGLKSNQAHLYRYCFCKALTEKADHERIDEPQRAHGRLDQRTYASYALPPCALAPRWQKAGVGTLIVVSRGREKLDGSQASQQSCYYVSNAQPTCQAEAEELFDAVRGHWLVEVMHHQRDVVLAEDKMKTESQPVSRVMSSLRTVTLNLLRRLKPRNMAAQIEEFADQFQNLIRFLTQQMVL